MTSSAAIPSPVNRSREGRLRAARLVDPGRALRCGGSGVTQGPGAVCGGDDTGAGNGRRDLVNVPVPRLLVVPMPWRCVAPR